MGIECSIARLLDAGGWLRLSAGGWLKLSWPHLTSGGRFACWFRKVAGWLRCFVWGLTRSSSGGVGGFDALSGVPRARPPDESEDSWFEIFRRLM